MGRIEKTVFIGYRRGIIRNRNEITNTKEKKGSVQDGRSDDSHRNDGDS
jgi:hypothetical protein